jgi:cystathionine beta-synthase
MSATSEAISQKTKRTVPAVMNNVLEAIGCTPMVKLNRVFSEFPNVNVLAKLEFMNPNGSMKDRIGVAMIERAEKEGRIKPGDTLVEPTSGNTGLGLAMAAAVKGYKMIITMPMKMSEEKRRLIRAFGAELILAPTELAHDHPDNYIEVAKRLAKERPNTHLLNQYENPGNPDAHYEGTGPEIWEQCEGNIDAFFAGMGTGGTISGVARYLKEQKPNVQIVGIDPEGSIYSGGEPGMYQVEGIGYDFFPKVFDVPIVDTMVRVNDKESFAEGRRFTREEGILAGGSTGSVLAGARKYLQEHDMSGKTIVLLIHDSGRSYLTKMFNDEWMQEQNLLT